MTQTKNPFFDQMAEAFNSAAGFTQGIWQEMETFFKLQAERILTDMNLVRREEFDVAKEMAAKSLDKIAELETRLDALEAKTRKQI